MATYDGTEETVTRWRIIHSDGQDEDGRVLSEDAFAQAPVEPWHVVPVLAEKSAKDAA